MKKSIKILVLIILTVTTGGCSFYKIWTAGYDSTLITIVLNQDTAPDMYQIFFDSGNGFNEHESVVSYFDPAKSNILSFTITSNRFRYFRIDPGTKESLIKISQICLSHGKTNICWQGADLIRYFTPVQHISEIALANNELVIKTSGNDPYLNFNADINQFIDFKFDWKKIVVTIIEIALFLTLIIFLLFFYDETKHFVMKYTLFTIFQKIQPGKFFLLVAFVWGLLMVFVTPPFQVPDEASHFFRSYQVCNFKFFPLSKYNMLGGLVPNSIISYLSGFNHLPFHPEAKTSPAIILSGFNTSLNADNQIFVQHINSAQYTPLLYVPQSVGMFLPRIFNASPPILFYAGRIGNLLLWVLLIYMAILITPFFKWTFLLLALLPMSVNQAASLSPDGMINGVSFFLVALVLKMAFTRNHVISIKEIVITLLLVFFLTIAKNVYFLLGGLVLLISKERFTTQKSRVMLYAGVSFAIVAAFVVNMLYFKLISHGLDLSGGLYASYPGYPKDIYPFKQFMHIINDLPGYFLAVLNYFTNYSIITVKGCIGILGWFDTPLPRTFYHFVGFILIITALLDKNKNVCLMFSHKILFSLIAILSVVTILTVLYLVWMPLGAQQLDLIHGRYLIPLTPVLMLIFYNRRLNAPNGFLPLVSVITVIVFIIVTLSSVIMRYYV